jgi:DNA primase
MEKLLTRTKEMTSYNSEDVKLILEQLGYKLNDRGKEWRSKPLYRDSDNDTSLKINKFDGRWTDFARNESGGIEQLVEKTLGISFGSGKSWIKKRGINKPDNTITALKSEEINLDYVKFFDPTLLNKLAQDNKYWNSRGIQDDTICHFKGGLCFTGKMAGRYVFPIFDEDMRIRGFSGRSIYPDNDMKWKHIGKRSDWNYPLFLTKGYIEKEKECIIIESIGDGLSLWQAGIRNFIISFGLNSLEHICYALIKLDPSNIIISFNNDLVGGNTRGAGNIAARNFKKTLETFFSKDQISIKLPELNDFGSMTKEQILQWKNK